MKQVKTIDRIFPPPPFHWVGNGFKVHNFLPGAIESDTRMSPFFLLDYNARMTYPPSSGKRGVGVHPHRGLETVTVAYHGVIAHNDSAGNHGVIYPGDVHWMTAGRAILHKEYQEQNFVKSGGDFQMVQLWINLPAKYKMTEPRYQEIKASDMGVFTTEQSGARVHVIAGEYNSVRGPAKTFTSIQLYNAVLGQNERLTFSFPQNDNTCMLLIEGSIIINETTPVLADSLVLFQNDGTEIEVLAKEKSVILVMSGTPIGEPVYPYGPFLMNTREEIVQAYDDYHKGMFGFLED